jgi:hypothetical protein
MMLMRNEAAFNGVGWIMELEAGRYSSNSTAATEMLAIEQS